MRKFWFLYLAKALVVWPGGFGTLDEVMEALTLIQTQKLKKKIPIVLYDEEYWSNIVNWDYMIEKGVIAESDVNYFKLKVLTKLYRAKRNEIILEKRSHQKPLEFT